MKLHRNLMLAIMPMALAATVNAADYQVEKVRHAGPFKVAQPLVLDSIDNNQTHYSSDNAVATPLSLDLAKEKPLVELSALRLDSATLNVVSFDVMSSSYVKDLKADIKGAKKYKLYADGVEQGGSFALQPGYHTLSLKFVADSAGLSVSLPSDALSAVDGDKHALMLADVLATRITNKASLSPSGRWALVGWRWLDATNKSRSKNLLIDLKTGMKRVVSDQLSWMPSSDRYYYVSEEGSKKVLKAVDPATGAETVLTPDMPTYYYAISPTETFAIIMQSQEGPKKEDGVFEIVHPDDRQPGWRTRYSLARLDFATGMVQPLTYTYHPVSISDITPDGRHILFSVATDSLTRRPTTRQTFYDLDLQTMQSKMLVEKDGFIGNAIYGGNADKVFFVASTEAFDGIGKRVPEGATPSMFDYHLYMMDTASRKVTPLTADDATSIEDVVYSMADKCLYYTAQNGDSVSLYRLDPKTLRSKMVSQPLEVLSGLSIAAKGGNIMVHGSSADVPYEIYNITSPSSKPKAALVVDPNADIKATLAISDVKAWSFESPRGDRVTGFYSMPVNFDPSKKYPVIVHYYGGCSPTSRRYGNGSHYPMFYWNALGYIVFNVNPSGASGFGQEWASRHVNTMGEGPAQDIIDATRQFVKDVPQCDADHIGCVSASYGGFMTQYMMTKDNPFACGVSHAGISSHASYWGEGYWGYSYSETSAANSYPWTRKDLFVERSPLYNVDKIKKPILFTHGTADTNVPVGESIQMYTALRLLGVPTAFVEVEGENHGIMDPAKRIKWINSIMAWFQRWLKDDSSWWDAIYTPKKL